ncbi:uncharacterized protein LOC125662472 [Ostrea edulis]|uniref:uncharacterized protein LOC125662472 n=1 Tax=Ostrea edulis TaxID=37623 RepID=UPI0024AFCCEA|nr:uncharacterized protein LOC125662472 [Ostrea edulis]
MGFNWRAILCLLLYVTLTVYVRSEQFYALDNPCLQKFRLCSTSCRVSYMTGSLNCQFCVCDDPRFSIAWPDSTTPMPTTTSTPRPTLPEGQWVANNLTYIRIKHPCSEFYAACPLVCERKNVTDSNGTTCEKCNCAGFLPITGVFGKRENADSHFSDKSLSMRQKRRQGNGRGLGPCFHFGCPILRCPEGTTFALSPEGCADCRCIPIATSPPITTAHASTSASINSHFIQMYCRKEPSDCPPGCAVVDFRVSDWHCYHCHCPDNNYLALQKPCDRQNYLCSSSCTIRNLMDSKNHTLSCEFCDCTFQASDANELRKFKRNAFCPPHCRGVCSSPSTLFGRRRRQAMGCPRECCRDNDIPPPTESIHTTAKVTPTSVDLPPLHQRNCFVDQSLFVDKNCLKIFKMVISDETCHVCLYRIGGQLAYLEHHDDKCFPEEYRDVLRHVCAHVSEVHSPSGVCLLCHYQTATGRVLLPKFKLPQILQQNSISIQHVSTQGTPPPTHWTTTVAPPVVTSKPKQKTTLETTTKLFIPQSTLTTTTQKPTTSTTTTSTITTTTQKPTTSTTTTSTAKPTTATTIESTTAPPPMCHTCSNVTCTGADLQECNTGSEYCMNTMTQTRDGSRTISRRCVSENECYNKWWIVSADNPSCLSKTNTPTGKLDNPIECNFCCKGAGCNKLMRIPDNLLYNGEDHPSNGMGGIIQIG